LGGFLGIPPVPPLAFVSGRYPGGSLAPRPFLSRVFLICCSTNPWCFLAPGLAFDTGPCVRPSPSHRFPWAVVTWESPCGFSTLPSNSPPPPPPPLSPPPPPPPHQPPRPPPRFRTLPPFLLAPAAGFFLLALFFLLDFSGWVLVTRTFFLFCRGWKSSPPRNSRG